MSALAGSLAIAKQSEHQWVHWSTIASAPVAGVLQSGTMLYRRSAVTASRPDSTYWAMKTAPLNRSMPTALANTNRRRVGGSLLQVRGPGRCRSGALSMASASVRRRTSTY